MPKNIPLSKLTQLENDKRLNPDYTTIERNARKHGWKPIKTIKVKSNAKPKIQKVPKVKQSDYKTFLKSKYWKYVHGLVITRDGNKCTKCGNVKRLQAHHLTYEHHYKEHLYLSDLITLCKTCHEKHHNISKVQVKSCYAIA